MHYDAGNFDEPMCAVKGTRENPIVVWVTVHPEAVTCEECLRRLWYIVDQVAQHGMVSL